MFFIAKFLFCQSGLLLQGWFALSKFHNFYNALQSMRQLRKEIMCLIDFKVGFEPTKSDTCAYFNKMTNNVKNSNDSYREINWNWRKNCTWNLLKLHRPFLNHSKVIMTHQWWYSFIRENSGLLTSVCIMWNLVHLQCFMEWESQNVASLKIVIAWFTTSTIASALMLIN